MIEHEHDFELMDITGTGSTFKRYEFRCACGAVPPHDHEWADDTRLRDRDRHEVCTICRERRYIPRDVEDVELP